MIKRLTAVTAFAVTLAMGASAPALAETWPDPKTPIRLIVPFTPGGTTDIMGRLIAEGLTEELGTTVIVENIPGANGNIGVSSLLRSKPDGNTLMLGTPGGMIVNQYIYPNLAYDPKKDLAHVALIADLPNVVMTHANSGINSVDDLVKRGKEVKDGLSFGSPSVGASGHISSELFLIQAGFSAVHVPYKGSSPMLTDLVGGNTDFTIDQISSALPFIQSGHLKPLAVTSDERSHALPAVPTLRELGFPDYVVSVWFCVAAPKGMPTDRIEKLNAAINTVLDKPEVRERIASSGARPLGGPPQDLTNRVLEEEKNISQVAKIVKFH